jgi:hypothetical protein
MSQPIQLQAATLPERNLISPAIAGRALLLALGLAWFALSPTAQAVDPPPDGGYPNNNTAEGEDALFSLTSGTDNTAIGFDALFDNTTGFNNTATGWTALFNNTTGGGNTASGSQALSLNTTGGFNTATGFEALFANKTGSGNTATGLDALFENTTGRDNTATGYLALLNNTTGGKNTATGFEALKFNTTGIQNMANGASALRNNETGNNNTANGFNALLNNTTGDNNIALGQLAGANLTTGNGNIDIGNAGVAGEAKTTRIGTTGTQRTFIAGISGVTVPSGVGVIVGTDGQLGTVVSSERFKEAVKPMDKASETILSLQPVTFRYKKELDPDGIPQFGLVAEEVEKVNPDLVARDEQGKPYTVRYDAVNAMLLNEFLKEHRKVEDLEARIAQQQKQIENLSANLQKVSDQLQLSRPASHVAANDQ